MGLEKNSTTKQIREYYISNPPDGLSKNAIKGMSDSDLLDMHYFMTEEDDDFDKPNAFDFDFDILCDHCREKIQKILGR